MTGRVFAAFRNATRLAFVSIGAAALATAIVGFGQETKLQTIRVVGGGDMLNVRVAKENGYLAKYGVAVDATHMPTSDSARADLASGKVDVMDTAMDNAIAVVELARADVILVMGGGISQDELIAQPDNKSVKDLRGKILIVDAPNTALALQMKKILILNGLKPGVDCEIKPLAIGGQRLVQMREHTEYAAAMMGAPTSIMAKRQGLVSLAFVPDVLGRIGGDGVAVRRQWAKDHADLLERYIAASIEAQRWIIDPANKQKVIELLAQDSKVPADVAEQTYELKVGGGWSRDLRINLNDFENILKLRAEVEGSWDGKPPSSEAFYDPSYYIKAISMIRSAQ